ncbi:MAG: hypothetical protein ABIR26_12110 [Ramlibacter sp.]
MPARSATVQPPIVVPPPVIDVPPRPAALPPVAMPLPPISVTRPTVITTCDTAGCWDSDGRRLNSHGPQLIGPRGPCFVQGALVNCP